MAGKGSKESRHPLDDRRDDYYQTPYEAIRALIHIEGDLIPKTILEPACGAGAIVEPLRATGRKVYATDLVARGCPASWAGVDFLMPFPIEPDIEGIVSNFPFKLCREFVEKSLTIAPYVAMLARLSFLEGVGRKKWFEGSPLARIHISSRRLPMMHRDGWDGPMSTSATCFAWFVWDSRHFCGYPQLKWFDWADFND